MMLLAVIGGVSLNSLRAQETITIGSGTDDAADLPVYSYYNYSVSQQIYLAEEMQGKSGNITSISLINVSGTQLNTRNIEVYMTHTTETCFSTTSSYTNFISMTAADQVYAGTYTFDSSTQYSTIELETPFAYNGQDNIILTFVDNTGNCVGSAAQSNGFYTFNSGTYRAVAHKQDSWGAYDITTLQAANGTSFVSNAAPRSAVNQIQFTFAASGEDPEEPGSEYATTFSFDFENENLSDFTLIDADGDGLNWFIDGNGFDGYKASSQSYGILPGGYQNVALTPDNYLVTNEKYSIVSNSELTFHVACPWEEHYGVAISEDGVNFTTVFEESYTGSGGKDQTVDLSAYAGQNVYIAIRHFNCSNGYFVSVDNLVLTGDASGEEPVDPIEPEVVQYRIKASTTGKYLHAFNNTKHESGAFGGVGVADFAESNAQIFTIEEGTNNQVYFRNADGYYVKCWAWNVDAYSTTDKTALIMDDAGDGTFYLRNCDNQKYFKIEYVDAGGQYFAFGDCDGSNCPVETWTLVPVETEQPTAPATPTNLAATATGETTIVLTWDAVEGATSYNVYSGTTTVATALTETAYTVENLTAGTEYCYNVTAVNEAGESEATADACATTNTAGPVNPEEGDFIVVGDVNTTGSTSVAPFRNSSKYSWVETYYPKEELGQAMTITSLAYKCATVNAGTGYTLTADEIEIYIGETDNDNHSSSAVWVPQDELTSSSEKKNGNHSH